MPVATRLVGRTVERLAPARLGTSFRWLLGSSWTSNLGDGLALAAGPLLVAAQTRDPFLVALAVVLQRLPWLLFGLLAGVAADRADRRTLVMRVLVVRGTVLAALCVAIVLDVASIGVVLTDGSASGWGVPRRDTGGCDDDLGVRVQ